MTKFNLTDAESARIRRATKKVGYVGVVRFRGPRGRNYRPIRTEASLFREAAESAVNNIRSRQYRNGAAPTGHDLYTIDHLGRVVA